MSATADRLPRTVLPRSYALTIEPDLTAATFTGEVVVEVEVTEPATEICCNAADLAIARAEVTDSTGTQALTVEIDPTREWLIARAVRPLAPGPATVAFAFDGVLNDQLRGFYRSTYRADDGSVRTLATTQFQATDARRAYPCWDEPDFKATFGLTLVVPDSLSAISNGSVLEETPSDAGRRIVRFAPTMPMSTYLGAFAIGPLAATEPIDVDGVPLRVVARPERLHLAAAALDVAAFSLRYLTEYFGRPYPADKLDLVAIPDFAFGAMENLGCVMFRETALLVDPDNATQPELLRVFDVIAHELAHMWFGDLVTMKWWEGIWLNEAFATFLEMKVTDAYRPSWQRWTEFSLSRTAAFDVDSLASTRPIEFAVHSPADAEAMFDVLTYEKGAAVVRMLEQYLGEERFREAIRRYIATHAYGNTVTDDLWEAIEAVTGEPVRRIMHSWIYQGGYPIVSVAATAERSLTLTQGRFGFSDDVDPSLWSIPAQLRVATGSSTKTIRVLIDRPTVEVAVAEGARVLTLNADASGFYRSRPSADQLAALAESGPIGLSAVERYMLVDDIAAATLAAQLEASELFGALFALRHEPDLSVWQRVIASIDSLSRIVTAEAREPFERATAELLRGRFDQLRAVDLDDERLAQLRATLFTALCRHASDARALAEARAIVRDGHTDPAMVAAAISAVAAHSGETEHAHFVHCMKRATSPQEEERYRFALAETPNPAAFGRTLAMSLDGGLRTQDAPLVLARALQNRHLGFTAWQFVAGHWDKVNAAFPKNMIARLVSGIVQLTEPDQADAIDRFLADHPVPQAQRLIDQSRERMRINARFRARESARFGAWLRQR